MRLVIVIAILIISGSAKAQTCEESIAATTPDDRFIDNADGTVTHSDSALMWMQCTLGQNWSEGVCTGDGSELSWQQGLQTAHGYSFAGYSDWRLPNIKELATIVELRCVRPSINMTLFPSTLSDDYWTATPSVVDAEQAWTISFANASNTLKPKQRFVFVRLVRTPAP
jgi:hypothetical protein